MSQYFLLAFYFAIIRSEILIHKEAFGFSGDTTSVLQLT